MTDPTTLEPCPACNGEGIFEAPPCNIPADVYIDCRNCAYESICGTSQICELCDGRGEVPSSMLTRKVMRELAFEG